MIDFFVCTERVSCNQVGQQKCIPRTFSRLHCKASSMWLVVQLKIYFFFFFGLKNIFHHCDTSEHQPLLYHDPIKHFLVEVVLECCLLQGNCKTWTFLYSREGFFLLDKCTRSPSPFCHFPAQKSMSKWQFYGPL